MLTDSDIAALVKLANAMVQTVEDTDSTAVENILTVPWHTIIGQIAGARGHDYMMEHCVPMG